MYIIHSGRLTFDERLPQTSPLNWIQEHAKLLGCVQLMLSDLFFSKLNCNQNTHSFISQRGQILNTVSNSPLFQRGEGFK